MKYFFSTRSQYSDKKNLNRFKFLLALCLLLPFTKIKAQSVGDTIVVKAFKYGSSTRDTAIQFPSGNLTFEKIIMKYNMRCKNNLVSNSSSPNQGCGEWDYSCNTYIVDSSRIENELNTAPKYIISNFAGNTFSYTSLPLYDYFNYTQTGVVLNNIINESQHTIGTGIIPAPNFLKSNERSGRSQILYTAAELAAAGLTAGNIDGFVLNVANAGGGVNFFKVGIQHTTQTSLNSSVVTLTGFTTVYNSNFAFTSGPNRVQFYAPFAWDGTSNLLIDCSFTNTNPGNPIVFNGTTTGTVMELDATNGYALDLSALGHVNINTTLLSAISNEVTFSFWAYGTSSLMPTKTSILYGYATNPNQRTLNIHLPWDNNRIYFDCGYSNGGFDRIEKVSVAAEQGGQWHHWAFTKNATTGAMNIYLNGAVWISGISKTKLMSFLNIMLGKDKDLQSNYKGKVKELTIWNKELSITDIQNWMKKPINASHPFYANLLAYYKMDEGNGLIITDSKNALTSQGTNVQWTYERGNKLEHLFYERNLRPNIIFVRGTYALTTTTVIVKDSVARNPSIIEQYSITPNAIGSPISSDAVTLQSTTGFYQALPMNIYNGDTGVLTGTIAVAPQGVITMSALPYYKRYPYYNEIMSFVTPYGLGLSLGPKGKSWYYDVTDFAPVLKGAKRFLMTMGGEYQEQMDIDFWFIVGTPPRNVIEFKQLWQGGARLGGVGIASINNDSRFGVQNILIPANAQRFKVRSTITGHGQQGEFSQSGGVVSHYFNINGGANEFTWPITMECSFNPVFPQGGTWVYDRQGWCPGAASLTKEHDITPFVTPGSTVTLDYNCSNPQVASGDYRYIVAHQLVSYGPANHSVDAAIEDVMAPSTKVFYSRTNPMCSSPVILARNTGSTAITTMDIDYWLNNSSQKETVQWSGNLAFMDTVNISLPIGQLWGAGLTPTGNVFHAEIKKVNGVTDEYAYNNMYHSEFTRPDIVTSQFSIEFRTNNNPFENTYKIVDENGFEVAGASALTTPNTTYVDNYELTGCFKLIVEDQAGDGVQWWANSAQGVGSVKLRNAAGSVVKTFQPDFGGGFEYSFSTVPPNFVGLEEQNLFSGIQIYPNPAHDKFKVVGNDLDNESVKITDLLGRTVYVPVDKDKDGLIFNSSGLHAGVYIVSITKNNETIIKKIVIH